MKTKKLSFSEIKNVMNRSEMKKIMAGSGPSGSMCSLATCLKDSDCKGECTCQQGGTAKFCE